MNAEEELRPRTGLASAALSCAASDKIETNDQSLQSEVRAADMDDELWEEHLGILANYSMIWPEVPVQCSQPQKSSLFCAVGNPSPRSILHI